MMRLRLFLLFTLCGAMAVAQAPPAPAKPKPAAAKPKPAPEAPWTKKNAYGEPDLSEIGRAHV